MCCQTQQRQWVLGGDQGDVAGVDQCDVLVDSNRSLTMLFVDQVNSRKEIKEAVDLAFKQDSQVFFQKNWYFSTTNFLQPFF